MEQLDLLGTKGSLCLCQTHPSRDGKGELGGLGVSAFKCDDVISKAHLKTKKKKGGEGGGVAASSRELAQAVPKGAADPFTTHQTPRLSMPRTTSCSR